MSDSEDPRHSSNVTATSNRVSSPPRATSDAPSGAGSGIGAAAARSAPVFAVAMVALTVAAGLGCLAGGARLALQGDWGWGLAVAVAGGWILSRSITGARAIHVVDDTTSSDPTDPGPPLDRSRR